MPRESAKPAKARGATLQQRLLGQAGFSNLRQPAAPNGDTDRNFAAPEKSHRFEAEILRRRGDLDGAERIARRWIAEAPDAALAWSTLGSVLADKKALSECRHCYETAIALDPALLEPLQNLAVVLQMLGREEEAEARYREVLKRAPANQQSAMNLAILLSATGRPQEALTIIADVIARTPRAVKAYLIASATEFHIKRFENALAWIEQAISLDSNQPQILSRRAEILHHLGRSDEALIACDGILCRFPADAETLHVKAFILRQLNRWEEALGVLRAGEATGARAKKFTIDRAWLLAELGRKDEALEIADALLAADPACPEALDCRAFLLRHKADHPDMAAMERVVGAADTPKAVRTSLSFALGKTYLDLGDAPKAFHHLNIANRLKRKTIIYDRGLEEQWFASIARLFSAGNMPLLAAAAGIATKRPIFVFGMPRSGTTLVEQILASHPQVRGTGESRHLNGLARSSVFVPDLPALTPEILKACGTRYLELAGAGVPASLYFVDKTPANFLYAGLISVMFPGARMIHCRRDPLDTCLSCYSLQFAWGFEFSYDLSELGHYYGLYRQLMAHWQHLLPPGTMLEMDYETLVADTEGQTRKILDHCGLAWDDTCLRFYETERLVTTSSLTQVRRPIYTSSVGKARAFRPWLAPLEDALANPPLLHVDGR